MPTFRSHGQLDDPFIEDGDQLFRGLDAYTEPSLLEQGMVTESINMRFDRGVAKVRKGLQEVATHSDICGLIKFTDPDGLDDVLVITPTQLHGVVVQTRTPLDLAESVSAKARGLQIFENVLVFDEGKRPQKSDGSNSFTSLSATPSINDGTFVACPDAPFGHYMANRLLVPDYDDSPSTLVCSDVFNENLFQLATGEFFLNKGTSNNKILSIQNFQDNQIIVFCASSVHLVNNIHSLDSASFEISRQYGIAGEKAVCQNGSYYYFMSNEGDVQVLVPQSDPAKGLGIAITKLNLDSEPLSKPITPLMEQIDPDFLNKTILHYHKNRVYCACRLNGEQTTTLLVYNSLLSMWESKDTLPIEVIDMVSHKGKLFLASTTKVYEFESSMSDDGTPITGQLTTRDYVLGSRDIKRFVRGTLGYGSQQDGRTQIKVQTKNPDKQVDSIDITETDNNFSRMQRFNARQRGYAASVRVEASSGSTEQSEIRRVTLEGFVANGRTGGDFDGN